MSEGPGGTKWSNVWTTQPFQEYIKFVTTSYGLTGIFTHRSPREMIEGYVDPIIEKLNGTPVYQGGDQTTSPLLSLDDPPTHPKDNPISFFTGEGDYKNTRRYASWLESDKITIQKKDYKSISQLYNTTFSPWREEVFLDGTDGMQFYPGLTDDSKIGAFVNDMSRNCYFDYTRDSDKYKHYSTKIYSIETSLM